MADSAVAPVGPSDDEGADWHRRVVGRSLQGAQRRSIDKGAHLIRAAAKVLERNGGASLTVQEVADEAGQSLRTLYQYFESKDDLLLAVHEEAMRTYARLIRAAIAGVERSPRAARRRAHRRRRGCPSCTTRPGSTAGCPSCACSSARPRPTSWPGRSSRSPTSTGSWSRARRGIRLAVRDRRRRRGLPAVVGAHGVHPLVDARQRPRVELPDPIDLSCFCLAGLGFARAACVARGGAAPPAPRRDPTAAPSSGASGAKPTRGGR